ncbi:MAG TPA: poly(R)-hydroxyalkanoic acid synthase subunit PhaE [Rhodothermales bacterium]|nr:poly(R)-hydroxyalkanoic acid synthase subunit PhaE [Rhodothermales bacterium]HRR09717.1 poly(R)-hydroxyalkanoic acid synthase subunit PhaE [Rhodothermales bacterium]
MFEDASRQWQSLLETGWSQWQQQLTQAMQGFGQKEPSWAAGVLKQAESAQRVWLSAMQTFANQATDFLERVKSPKDFPVAFAGYQEALSKQFTDAASKLHVNLKDHNALWEDFLSHYKAFQGMGNDFFESYKAPSQGFTAPNNPEEWMQSGIRFMQHLFDQAGGKTFDAPGLGMMRNYTHLVGQSMKAFREEKEAEQVYQKLVAKTWASVVAQMTKTVWERGQEGKSITSLRELSRVWAGVTDEVFMDVFKTDEYVQKQLNYLNASFRFRQTKRALNEVLLEAYDLPTLTQVDDLIERVYTLRKVVRAAERGRATAEKEVQLLKKQVSEQAEALAGIQAQLRLIQFQETGANGQVEPMVPPKKRTTRKPKSGLS